MDAAFRVIVEMNMAVSLAEALIAESIIQLEGRSLSRIGICFEALSEEQVWQAPGPQVVSIGHLVLHLNGNVRQWICSGLGDDDDGRERSQEFSTKDQASKAELIAMTRDTLARASAVLRRLTEPDLLKPVTIQGIEGTGVAALLHVVEHFSYHVGQISYWTKIMTEVDLGYYSGFQLDQRNDDKRSKS